MKPCANVGCDGIFETTRGLEYHMRYHCGNEPNPYHPETRMGNINRKTLYGHGIPPTDVQQCKGLIYFDRLKMTWNCMKCQYAMGVYEWRQVYSHVRAVHGYTSRVPNGRWNMPLGGQYKPESKEQEHNIVNPEMKMEIQTQRVIIQEYNSQPE